MPGPTNLTDRISHLRDRKGRSPVVQGGEAPIAKKPTQQNKRSRPERRLANDYFMLFVYALLAISLVTQLGLVVWLDLI
jgi:nitrate reductase NapE component